MFIRIGSISDLPSDGAAREFGVAGRTICVANVDGTYAAMDNVCPHRGSMLGQGTVASGKVICPWHGWEFDPQSGAASHDENEKVPVYELKIEGEDVLVDVPSR